MACTRAGLDRAESLAAMSDVRRQRRPSPASRVGLQSCQFPAYAGDAGADQRLVADEPEGKTHQDRREGREPRPLCRVPDGRGRHPSESVRRHPTVHRGTSTAASHINRVKRSFVTRRAKLTGGLCPNDGKNIVPRHRLPLRGQRRANSRPPPGTPGSNIYTPNPLNRGRGGSGFVIINSGDAGSHHPADVGLSRQNQA